MKSELVQHLRCPVTGQPLVLEADPGREHLEGEISEGWLVVRDSDSRYSLHGGIPRFVPASNYADNFGMQWNRFRLTQLDSHSGQTISADRFWRATGWLPEQLRGRWVLDVGCGAGRFAEIALQAGANVVALDYSSAVDACYSNLRHFPRLHVLQGDIYALPFQRERYDFVYSLGVLQHTPDVKRAFQALVPMVAPGGELCVDYYWKRVRTMLNPKYALRPLTKRMSQQRLFALLELRVPGLLRLSQLLGRVPLAGPALKRLLPVVDYTGVYPLNAQQLKEWALLDTFDMLGPAYDNPQTPRRVKGWFDSAGFRDIQVFHEGHLVARGRKPGPT